MRQRVVILYTRTRRVLPIAATLPREDVSRRELANLILLVASLLLFLWGLGVSQKAADEQRASAVAPQHVSP